MKAWELLERGWTQGSLARDAAGKSVYVDDPSACQFCPAGAVARAYGECDAATPAVIRIISRKIKNGVTPWNDAPGRTQAEVVAVVRQAEEEYERSVGKSEI